MSNAEDAPNKAAAVLEAEATTPSNDPVDAAVEAAAVASETAADGKADTEADANADAVAVDIADGASSPTPLMVEANQTPDAEKRKAELEEPKQEAMQPAWIMAILVICCGGALATVLVAAVYHFKYVYDFDPGTIVVVSLDGLRADHLQVVETPHLARLINNGVRADATPIFPSQVFPNLYTAVTGLYPEDSGIIADRMRDAAFAFPSFTTSNGEQSDGRWFNGEPVWNTAASVGLLSASMGWPAGDASIQSKRPAYYVPFVEDLPAESRIQIIASWMQLKEEVRPRAVFVRFEQLASVSARYGPKSAEALKAVANVDAILGQLFAALDEINVTPGIDFLIMSQGLVATDATKLVKLSNAVNINNIQIVEASPVLFVNAVAPLTAADLVTQLKTLPHLTVYAKEDIPAAYHLKGSSRVTDVIAIADEGWTIVPDTNQIPSPFPLGAAGYLASDANTGVFVGFGPHFKAGVTSSTALDTVQIYQLMCRLLTLTPATSTASAASLDFMFRD